MKEKTQRQVQYSKNHSTFFQETKTKQASNKNNKEEKEKKKTKEAKILNSYNNNNNPFQSDR